MRHHNEQGIVANGVRVCTLCSKKKILLLEFSVNKKGLFGRNAFCRECEKIKRAKYRKDNAGKIKKQKAISNAKRRSITRTGDAIDIASLRELHGDYCCYCKVVMNFVTPVFAGYDPDRASIEHVVALSRGGAHTFENTKLACLSCNISKGNQLLEEWSRWL